MKNANPAVVTVRIGENHGSGFTSGKDGWAIANAHVAAAEAGVVTLLMADEIDVVKRSIADIKSRNLSRVATLNK